MRDILILVHDQMQPTQLKQALEVLGQHKVRGVGANLIWSADLGIHYGALVKNDSIIERCSHLIGQEIKVSTGEGIQPDYSYHQHESRLQIYHYGSSFLRENVRIAWELRNTVWAVPQAKIDILTDFIVKGWQWMARGINTVPGTIDRAASRQDQLHNADIRSLIPYLCELNPAYTTAFTSIAEMQNNPVTNLSGFRYFPYSDFTAYHQNEFSFFIKTISTRTLKSESINTENLKGRLLNNGDAYLIKNGNEYFNLMPVWNWNFLPGQTYYKSSTDTILSMPYAGSVTDGKTGLTAMEYVIGKGSPGIAARKFWACNNNIIVCLISNLKAVNIKDSIFTALDQCRLQGDVQVNKPGNIIKEFAMHELKKVKWIYHSNVGYINLVPSTVQLQVNKITSSWSAINASASTAPITENVFMPLLYHDLSAGKGSMGYVLASCNNAAELKLLADKPTWKVIRNDSVCQAVEFNNGIVMAAFYSPGAIKTGNDKTLTVDKPCLVQLAKTSLYVSDPLHKGEVINIKMNNRSFISKMNNDGTTINFVYSDEKIKKPID
jgi:chondroitin AC lyase